MWKEVVQLVMLAVREYSDQQHFCTLCREDSGKVVMAELSQQVRLLQQ